MNFSRLKKKRASKVGDFEMGVLVIAVKIVKAIFSQVFEIGINWTLKAKSPDATDDRARVTREHGAVHWEGGGSHVLGGDLSAWYLRFACEGSGQ